MKATFNGTLLAESDQTILIEGNHYFPPESVKREYFSQNTQEKYTCPWKGECQYWDVTVKNETVAGGGFTYPQPKSTAIKLVGKDFSNYMAFWRGVEVSQ